MTRDFIGYFPVQQGMHYMPNHQYHQVPSAGGNMETHFPQQPFQIVIDRSSPGYSDFMLQGFGLVAPMDAEIFNGNEQA
jgi:hypothetical protein